MNGPARRAALVAATALAAVCAMGVALGLPARALADPPPVAGLVSPSHPLSTHWYADAAPRFVWRGMPPGEGISGYSFELDQDGSTVPDTTVDVPALAFDVLTNPSPVRWPAAIADFNRDGRSDAAYDLGPKVEVRLARPNGTLGAAHDVAVTLESRVIAAADVNGDGKPDIVAAGYSGPTHAVVDVLLGRGDGTFRPARHYRLGPFTYNDPCAIALRDLNGDHRRDILVTAGTDVVVLLGNGNGTFGRERVSHSIADDPRGDLAAMNVLAFGDVNGDGRVDLVTGGTVGQNTPEGLLSVLLGRGDGTFRILSTADGRLEPQQAVLGDLDRDGKLDLVVQYYQDGDDLGGPDYSVLTVSRGDGHGAFTKLTDDQVPPAPPFAAADYDRDGNLDIALGTSTGLEVLLGNGDASFAAPATFGQGSVTLTFGGDFDGDGRPDVLAAIGHSAGAVFLDRSGGAGFTGVADGIWYFHVRAVDGSGVGGPAATRDVRIDTHRPSAHAPEAARVKPGGIARLTCIVADPSPCAGWCNLRIVVTDLHGGVKAVLHVYHVADGARSHVPFHCRLAKGTYSFHVYATDPAGNRSGVATNALFVS